MRSPREIWFRAGQEIANLRLRFAPPNPQFDQPAPLLLLPSPEKVAGELRATPLADEVLNLAGTIVAHRFPLLGVEIDTGPQIAWRRDYLSGKETPALYFRRIPYLDAGRAGDHKIIWELNRHQHLVLLAQAFLLSGERRYEEEIRSQLLDWQRQNPYMCGVNWVSALEVAFRAISWIWVYHLVGAGWESGFRQQFLASLYRHGRYLQHNLSYYFSPNTHLLGEAVALHALGVLFPSFPGAASWAATALRVVREQLDLQVREDGSHFEQSSYYHVYALDLFLFHDLLSPLAADARRKLAAMAEFLRALLTPAGTLPFLGDDDGGRLLHPYGPRERFACSTVNTAADRLSRPDLRVDAPAAGSRLFSASGIAVLRSEGAQVLVDAGPFAPMSAGHSHSDTLSVLVFAAGQELLTDPGTYTYVGDAVWRERFRGSAAHNTVRIDGIDQATPAGPFSWRNPPIVEILAWESNENFDEIDAVCSYAGFRHRRRVRLHKPGRLWILDEIKGPPGEHDVEQFWHPGVSVKPLSADAFSVGPNATLRLSPGSAANLSEGDEYGWRSLAPGRKTATPLIRVHRRCALPARLGAVLDWRSPENPDARDVEFLNTLDFG